MLWVTVCLLTLGAMQTAVGDPSGTGRSLLERGYPELFKSATEFKPVAFNCDRMGRFPFMASIKDRTVTQNHLCGGILIASDAVLTAAHCVDPRATRNAVVYPAIALGGLNLRDFVEERQTIAAFPHPDWTGDIRDGHDLVILKLDSATCLTPIATLSNRRRIRDDVTYEFFGYGRSGEAGAFTNLLVNAAFNGIEDNDCREKFGVALRDNEFCFNLDGISGVCSGDTGGPLIVAPETFFAFYEEVIGIVSYATSDCLEEGAAVFMDIASFRDWIGETLESDAFKNA